MSEPGKHPILGKMIERLRQSLGDRLVSVILYGSAARGDFHEKTSDLNILIVTRNLEPETLELLTPAVTFWEQKGQPAPRLFSPSTLSDSTDVFPVEFIDIKEHRIVLHGPDPFESLELHPDHLRLQCERELREKMMRLREAYIEVHPKPKELSRLLTTSYTTFVALFRGGLHLLSDDVPVHNEEVVTAFCERTGLDRSAFEQVDRLKRGESVTPDPRTIFSRYYAELIKAVEAVDRLRPGQGGESHEG